MNKKVFLICVIILVVAVSIVATMYPASSFLVALALLPITFVWCVATTPNKGDK